MPLAPKGGRVTMYHVEPIPRSLMAAFDAAHHYALRVPPHCLLSLGCFRGTDLVGVASWGFGVRPRHTIQRLFPSLGTADYYELNRLCMLDSEPRNGETQFLRLCREYIRHRQPGRAVFFSWADGMRGTPGYVYQADNWLYGGFIRTEFYVTAKNKVVHPRQVITRCGRKDRAFTRSVGLRRVRGRQFRYCHFLCAHVVRKRRLRESLVRWGRAYPKMVDCVWTFENGEGAARMNNVPYVGTPGTAPLRLSDLQGRDDRGLVCRQCGCRHFYTVYTRPKPGCIVRSKACRHCGQRMITRERAG